MRAFVSRRRIRSALHLSSVSVFGLVLVGCSSGFERFDYNYNSAAHQQGSSVSNPYPGNVDPTTTASTGNVRPMASVAPKPVPQGVYHPAEPRYAAPAPVYQPQQTYQQPRQPLNSYTPAPVVQSPAPSSTITTTELPRPAPITYTPPQPSSDTVYIAPKTTDRLTTSSIAPQPVQTVNETIRVPSSAVARNDAGWTATGGTTITARAGETLYNLSKRYGVPVDAIRKVNGMGSDSQLQAGQKLVIPNYIYSPTSEVSAPDSNPETRASSASTGYIGEAKQNVAVPTRKPYEIAAVSPAGTTVDATRQRYAPRTHVTPPTDYNKPDYSVVTGAVSGSGNQYIVRSGDTLSKIAREHKTNVNAIIALNNLSGTNIRSGQKLKIPGQTLAPVKNTYPETKVASTEPVKSVPEVDNKSVAPARTGISEFRWPVRGRVVSGFGDKLGSGKNDGIDISVPEGTAVRAAENGVVIYAGEEISMYGKLVLVRHEDGWVSAYAHNRDFAVKKGDRVTRGQVIARSGRTGETDRPKVHFELRKDSNPVNPIKYLAQS